MCKTIVHNDIIQLQSMEYNPITFKFGILVNTMNVWIYLRYIYLPYKPTIPETVSLLKYITKFIFCNVSFLVLFMAIGLQSARSTHI